MYKNRPINSISLYLHKVYRFNNIRIALVKMETWKDNDLFYVDQNASKALKNFMEYKSKYLDKDKGKHFDNVQFITYVHLMLFFY